MWDRADEAFDDELEREIHEEVMRLEAECRRLGIPIPEMTEEISPVIRHRRREMNLTSHRDRLRAVLSQRANDPYAGRSYTGELKQLVEEIRVLERRCAERGITPPAFEVNPKWYGHTERMAHRRRRDTLRDLLDD